jgi:hypothetical protein
MYAPCARRAAKLLPVTEPAQSALFGVTVASLPIPYHVLPQQVAGFSPEPSHHTGPGQ